MAFSILIKKRNTQHNDTQHNGTWNSILLCWVSFKLSVVMLNVIM